MIERIQKTLIVAHRFHNQRIDSVLAQLLPEYSRSQLSFWIKTGSIVINQKSCKPKDKVLEGDVIHVEVHFATAIDNDFKSSQPEPIPLEIIYEDSDILIINKPAGLVVHPGAGNKVHTLVNALLYHDADLHHLPRAGIVHRLDKDTTGLLTIAKSITAHATLIRQMQAREVKRHYLALVQGYVTAGGTVDTGFARHSINRLKMKVAAHGRQAITHYAVHKHYQQFTLLDVHLMTGRTHQIRVHMEYLRHAVVGDPLYGGRTRLPAGLSTEFRVLLQQFRRQALHAKTLSFNHPKTGNLITFEAPIPDDFQLLIDALNEYNKY